MLRADERTKRIAILALTRLTSNSFRRLRHDAGCDAYLQKPVDGSTVVSKVSRLLENAVS
jgi:DNA-binding response OmpR family regulator